MILFELIDSRLFFVFLSSALICGGIIAAFALTHRRWIREGDSNAVQSAHRKPTPRIGGVALVAAMVIFIAFLPQARLSTYITFCFTLLPVFLAGLSEDLDHRVSPRLRLLAAVLSSALAIGLFQIWLPRTDLFLLDVLMPFAPFAIALTIFMGATACNAFNLIDGLNGLAAGTAIMVSIALALIAVKGGIPTAAQGALVLAGALAGFFIFNYPMGMIFLGDAGAYSIGHILIWLAIVLLVQIDEVSGVALLLVFFWPAADTIFSIYRRRRSKRAITQPDRLHFHQFVMRAIELVWLDRRRRHIANPLASATILLLAAAPVTAGVAFWDNTAAASLFLVFFSALFVGSYIIGIRLARRLRKTRPASETTR